MGTGLWTEGIGFSGFMSRGLNQEIYLRELGKLMLITGNSHSFLNRGTK